MKLKDLLLGICVVALLVSEAFLYSANRQKNIALDQFRGAKQQLVQMHTLLQEVQASGSEAQNAEIARLKSDAQDLPRLRKEIQQLRLSNQQLTQDLQTAKRTAQEQQEQLAQYQAQADAQAQAPPAPTLPPPPDPRAVCISNLRIIDNAKQQWALENTKNADAVPTAQDLLMYFKDNAFPSCPSGGIYIINAVGVLPTCSIAGHVLPPDGR